MKAGWQTKRLEELIKLEYGKPLPDEKRKAGGKYPVYGANGEKDRTDEFYFDKPSIIVGRKGSAGEINLTEEKFWPLDVTYFVKFDEKELHLKFLYSLLATLDLPKLAKGVKPGINRNEVYSIDVKIPPLPEQKRIVAILDESFEGIAIATANAKKNLLNARELFESALQSVFANRGDGWEKMELMEICEQITDGSHFSPKSSSEEEYPYITVRDIDDDIINFENCKFISKSNYHSLLKNGCKPHSGDLLFSKDGTVGKVSLVDFEKDFVVLSSLAIIRPKRKIIISSLLKYILKNPAFLQKAIGMKTGVAIRRIILKNLKLIEVSFPKSLPEQQTIVKKLDTLSAETKKLEAIYQQKLTALDELKKSILNQAFAGKL